MRVLITGGAGFIGHHLAAAVSRDPDVDLVILDNLTRGAAVGLPANARLIVGDIRDRSAVQSAMAGVNVVYHLAAQSNVIGAVKDLDYSFSTNVVGTFEVLRSALENKVGRVVFTSSREVYGEVTDVPVDENTPMAPKNSYGASKAAGETYASVFQNSGLSVVVLRLANVYGPGDRDRVIPIFIDQATAGKSLALYGGDQVLDFVWIDVVVHALQMAARCESVNQPVNVGSGHGTAIRALAERIVALTGSRSGIEVLPVRSVETTRFIANIGRAVKVFGISSPRVPLEHLPAMTMPYGIPIAE